MARISHIGQYWSAERREVRLLAVTSYGEPASGTAAGEAVDLTDALALGHARRRYRETVVGGWAAHRWTYPELPLPSTELFHTLDERGRSLADWAEDVPEADDAPRLSLESLDREPSPDADHLVCPIVPRRALAFGVTYLNSALERETEGRRSDYSYVYRAVKDRGERPELFLKGTSREHFVGPRGRMALRSDLTNSETRDGSPSERVPVSCGIEPELAAIVSSSGEIQGYALADDVSGNQIENETLLYLTQAKFFTGCLVLGPLVLVSREQTNPGVRITTRILSSDGELLVERETDSSRINAPLSKLVGWAGSHIRLTPGEVISTGTDCVPDGRVKVLEEGMRVEISSPSLGRLIHGAGVVRPDEELNPDYARLELEAL